MQNSSMDMLALVAELNSRRIAMVGGRRVARQGGMRLLSERAVQLLRNARALHRRYLLGDYRHSDQERGQIVELCNMLIQWHAENEGTKRPDMWQPTTAMDSKTHCQARSYDAILGHAAVSDDWSSVQKPKGGAA